MFHIFKSTPHPISIRMMVNDGTLYFPPQYIHVLCPRVNKQHRINCCLFLVTYMYIELGYPKKAQTTINLASRYVQCCMRIPIIYILVIYVNVDVMR